VEPPTNVFLQSLPGHNTRDRQPVFKAPAAESSRPRRGEPSPWDRRSAQPAPFAKGMAMITAEAHPAPRPYETWWARTAQLPCPANGQGRVGLRNRSRWIAPAGRWSIDGRGPHAPTTRWRSARFFPRSGSAKWVVWPNRTQLLDPV